MYKHTQTHTHTGAIVCHCQKFFDKLICLLSLLAKNLHVKKARGLKKQHFIVHQNATAVFKNKSLAPHCRVLPPDEFNGMIIEPLTVTENSSFSLPSWRDENFWGKLQSLPRDPCQIQIQICKARLTDCWGR